MKPNAIYSKSGKGVQEASGKTSLLSRSDRAVLSAFDGRLTVKEVAERVGKTFDANFERIIRQLERDGFVREVSAGAPGTAAKPGAARPTPAKPASAPADDELDFTSMPASRPGAAPRAAPPDLAAKARADAERKEKEEQALSYKTREEAEAKAAAAAKLRAEAEEKAKRQRERIKTQAAATPPAALEISFGADIAIPGKADPDSTAKMQAVAFAKAREEAEEKAQKERDRIKAEAEAKLLAETEAKLRSEAEIRENENAEAKRKADAEAQVKAAREEALRVAFEAERAAAREEAERSRKEAEERARQEERRRKEDEERRAREDQERRAREDQERKAREDQERKAREDQERKAREDQERKAREEAAAREKEDAERLAKEDFERALREVERTQREANEKAKGPEKEKEKTPAPAATGDPFADSLMADLNSFDQRENEELKAKQEFVRKEKEGAQRRAGARAETERKAREESERSKREEDERRRKDEEEGVARQLREKEARAAQEREAREAEERERQALVARIEEAAAATKADEDIPVRDSDLGMDDVKRDQAAVSKKARERERNAAREREREAKEREAEARERARERKREAKRAAAAPPPAGGAYAPIRRSRSWGRRIAVILFLLLAAGIGAIHVMPLETQEYEQAASEAIGQPVKIRSVNLSLYNGVLLRMEGVSIGHGKIETARAYPEIGSFFDDKKAFSRIELDGVSLPQRDLGAVLGAQVKSGRFSVARVSARALKLEGVLAFPELEADMMVARDGSIGPVTLRGPGSLTAKLAPKGSNVEFDVTASSFSLPIAPDVTLSAFAMKGVARGDGMRIDSWGGGNFDGAVSGTATIRWGSHWNIDGVLTVRGMSGALFAPTLLYEGKVDGTGRFSVNGPDPTKFMERGRLEGSFSVPKGVLGAFDLSRAIRTGGREAAGRTPFTGLSAQGLFDKGAIALRNVAFSAGAMNAGASADIAADGALSGRIVADIRTSSQTLRATVNLGGTLKEPQVKN